MAFVLLFLIWWTSTAQFILRPQAGPLSDVTEERVEEVLDATPIPVPTVERRFNLAGKASEALDASEEQNQEAKDRFRNLGGPDA